MRSKVQQSHLSQQRSITSCGGLHTKKASLLEDTSTTSVRLRPNSGWDYVNFESLQPLCSKYFQGIFDTLLHHPPHRALRLLVVTSSLASQSRSRCLTDNICQTAAVRKPTFFPQVTRWAVAEVTLVTRSQSGSHGDSVCFWNGFASAQVSPSADEETVWRVNPSSSSYCIVVNEAGRILPRHLCNQLKMLHPPSNHFTLTRCALVCFMAILNHYRFFFLKHSVKLRFFSSIFFLFSVNDSQILIRKLSEAFSTYVRTKRWFSCCRLKFTHLKKRTNWAKNM